MQLRHLTRFAFALLASCGQSREAAPPHVTLTEPVSSAPAATHPTTVASSSRPPLAPAPVAAQPRARGMVTLDLATQGARVLLVSGADQREVSMFPIRIAIDTSQAWTIEANKPGYRPYRQPIDFADGVREKSFTIVLTR